MIANKPKIYFDSCCIIDIVAGDANITTKEKREFLVQCYKDLLQESKKKNISVVTSSITILECIYVKDENKKQIMTDEVKRLFNSFLLSGLSGITLIMPTMKIVESARQKYWDGISCKPYDLLHIASAIEVGCDEFITTDVKSIDKNDNVLKIKVLGLNIIQVSDSKYLSPEASQMKFNY